MFVAGLKVDIEQFPQSQGHDSAGFGGLTWSVTGTLVGRLFGFTTGTPQS